MVQGRIHLCLQREWVQRYTSKGLCMFIVWFNVQFFSRVEHLKKNFLFFLNGESQSTNVTEKNQYKEELEILREKGAEKERPDETSERPWTLMFTSERIEAQRNMKYCNSLQDYLLYKSFISWSAKKFREGKGQPQSLTGWWRRG